eukprot:TRINITY_DN16630_c0_g3_i1.p1 TRINITY_DN16630_c0_g3~~TRINITY_DN16630_c0_g3_i1.p1  ORF type:complete len:735 (+),score=158.55 TRINITY_DN16630_c0_g3_i1:94-2298(+)
MPAAGPWQPLQALVLLLCSAVPGRARAEEAVAHFAMGCFWTARNSFTGVTGVTNVEVGYMGGFVPNPTQERVGEGTTGHAETVRVTYDPARTNYQALLDVFWTSHSPYQQHGQGLDVGTQFRVAVFVTSPQQGGEATAFLAQQQKLSQRVPVARVEPAGVFYPARTSGGGPPTWHCRGSRPATAPSVPAAPARAAAAEAPAADHPPGAAAHYHRSHHHHHHRTLPLLASVPDWQSEGSVTWEEGRGSGTVTMRGPAPGSKGALHYTVNDQPRPAVTSIKFHADQRALQFTNIHRAVVLPRRGSMEVAAAVRDLADRHGVPHDIPDDAGLAAARGAWTGTLPGQLADYVRVHSGSALRGEGAAVCERHYTVARWDCPTKPGARPGEFMNALAFSVALNRTLVAEQPDPDNCDEFAALRDWVPLYNDTERVLRARCTDLALADATLVKWADRRHMGKLSEAESGFGCCTMPWRARAVRLRGGNGWQAAWMQHNQALHPRAAQRVRELFEGGVTGAYGALWHAAVRWGPRVVMGVERTLAQTRSSFAISLHLHHSRSDERSGLDAAVDETAAKCTEALLNERNSTRCAVIVASDRAEGRYFARDRFRSRCTVVARPGADTAGGMRDALFDLYMLSRGDAVVGVRGSHTALHAAHLFVATAPERDARVVAAHPRDRSCRPLPREPEPAPRCVGNPAFCPTPGRMGPVLPSAEDESETTFMQAFKKKAGPAPPKPPPLE